MHIESKTHSLNNRKGGIFFSLLSRSVVSFLHDRPFGMKINKSQGQSRKPAKPNILACCHIKGYKQTWA